MYRVAQELWSFSLTDNELSRTKSNKKNAIKLIFYVFHIDFRR